MPAESDERDLGETMSSLRRRAEREAAATAGAEQPPLAPAEAARLLHELRVHQIELETQNAELQRAQVELEASRARYFHLYDLAPVGYLTLDERELILEANLPAATLLSTPRSALAGQPVTRFVLPGDQDVYYRYRRRLLETGQPQTCELRLRQPEGGSLWARLDATVTRNGGVEVPFCRVTITDISQSKQAEGALMRLGAAIDQSAEAVVITDAAASIQYVNPAFEQVSGYTRDEVVGRNPRLLKSGKQDAEIYRRMWAALASGQPWRGRLINRRKDGALYEEDANISPVRDRDGRIVNYVAVKRDVTRESELEAQLRQAQKMESIGRLAGGIAHDFNNLLQAILGYSEIALRALQPDNPVRRYIEQIRVASERAATLTRQLLAFGRKQVLQPRVMDLNDLVDNLTGMLRRLLGEEIVLSTTLDPALGSVRADPGQIEQVITNLALNARDAMHGKGVVSIRTANVDLSGHGQEIKPGHYVLLTVDDKGSGMSDEVKAHLFEPFYTTKDQGKGTGLGLPMVYGIVKQSGGHITVDSDVGRGTTVSVLLPRIDEPAQVSPAEAGSAGMAHGTETILLVEDEDYVRGFERLALERLGYAVLAADSGAAAVTLAAGNEGRIRLLITDVVMPGMSGLALASALTGLNPGLRVLFVSGYARGLDSPQETLPAGSAFLQKPFTVEDLARKVRELLDA